MVWRWLKWGDELFLRLWVGWGLRRKVGTVGSRREGRISLILEAVWSKCCRMFLGRLGRGRCRDSHSNTD